MPTQALWKSYVPVGTQTAARKNPMSILPDIKEKVKTLDPEWTPALSMLSYFPSGRPAQNKKVWIAQHYGFDHWDVVTAVTVGAAPNNRFARLTISNKPRLNKSTVFYSPQDVLRLPNDQVVEIVMTENAAYDVNGQSITLPIGLTGNTTTRSAPGTIVVRAVQEEPIRPFTRGDIIWMGRTIWESQPVGGLPRAEDIVYTYNFVEHMEEIFEITEDQQNFYKTRFGFEQANKQLELLKRRIHKNVDYRIMWGQRAVNFDQFNRPTYRMAGIMEQIRTNITYYNPDTTDDFETLVSEFMYQQAFRHNPNGNTKVGLAGPRFLNNFQYAFKSMRRHDTNDAKVTPGLNIDTYNFMGFNLKLVLNPAFRHDTYLQDWLVVIDPVEFELKTNKGFVTKQYASSKPSNPDRGRVDGWAIEWQGTILGNFEETSAVLRTAAAMPPPAAPPAPPEGGEG
jgi:hypothetical protein